MSVIFQVQINIVLSVLLIILLSHAYFNMNKTKRYNVMFMTCLGLTVCALTLEMLSVVLDGPQYVEWMALLKLINMTGFLLTPGISVIGLLFCSEWVKDTIGDSPKLNPLVFIPFFINALGSIASFFTNFMFTITAENKYVRGPYFWILPTVSYFYMVVSVFFIYQNRKKLNHWEKVVFSSLYIVPALLSVIQIKFGVYLTIWNSTALILIVMYVFILNEQAFKDGLTGLENRLSYEHFAQNISPERLSQIFLVYIDLDGLKAINDQFGHHEGDYVIRLFAKYLYEAFDFKQKKVFRLGGDEFLVLLDRQTKATVESYLERLNETIEAQNYQEEKKYVLRYSYGFSYNEKFVPSKTMYQLLEEADQQMYSQKKTRKRGH